MAKVTPTKPARYYPANVVHAIRVRLTAGPNPAAGEIGLKPGKVHIGTLPANALLFTAVSSVLTAVVGGTTINIGDNVTADNVAKSADIAPATLVNAKAVVPTLGYVAVDTPIYVTLGGAAASAGVVDIVIPYYASKD